MEWISVRERFPDEDYPVLVYGLTDCDIARFYPTEGWYSEAWGDVKGITHWMQLPDPPKE